MHLKQNGPGGTAVRKGSVFTGQADPKNMSVKEVVVKSLDPHAHRFWEKDVALENICVMFVTCETFQVDTSWLKATVFENIEFMSVTLTTSHNDKS